MAKRVELDISRCCACGACSIACMDQNDIDLKTGVRPFRTVFRQEFNLGKSIEYYSVACMHCENAPCVTACPSGVLYKDKETGLTLYDNTNCIGCHSCAMACPFGAPTFGEDDKMTKCDGCYDRIKAGLQPACVSACFFRALKVVDDENPVASENSLIYQCDQLVRSQK